MLGCNTHTMTCYDTDLLTTDAYEAAINLGDMTVFTRTSDDGNFTVPLALNPTATVAYL